MKIHRLTILAIALTVASLATTTVRAEDYRLDDELFRRGLIDRGLDSLLATYDKQHPPQTDIDLLAGEIAEAWRKYRRADTAEARLAALNELLRLESDRIDVHSDDALAATWRVRYARDLLNEKAGRLVFFSMLDLHLSTAQTSEFQKTLSQVAEQLTEAQTFLEKNLHRFRQMNDAELEHANDAGLPELYQTALTQAKLIDGWCMFYRLKLVEKGERIRLLYKLRDRLDELTQVAGGIDDPGFVVLRSAVLRRLGSFQQASELLDRLSPEVGRMYTLIATIESAEIAIKHNQPRTVVELAQRIHPDQWADATDRGAVDLVRSFLLARATLIEAEGEGRCRFDVRREAFAPMSSVVGHYPELGEMIFEDIESLDDCPLENMSSLELYAKARLAEQRNKSPLARRALELALARDDNDERLQFQALRMLTDLLARDGDLEQASEVLATQSAKIGNDLRCQVLAQSAFLSWQAYRKDGTELCRNKFIVAATKLLTDCSTDPNADQFRLLLADQLSQMGKFQQAMQWIKPVAPGSPLFIDAQAVQITLLSRRFDELATTNPPAAKELAERVQQAVDELLAATASGQKTPTNLATWQLNDRQLRAIGGAIITASHVMSDPQAGMKPASDAMMKKYEPLLAKYNAGSTPAQAVRVIDLCKQDSSESLTEAVRLCTQLMKSSQLAPDDRANLLVTVLVASHRHVLNTRVGPMTGDLPKWLIDTRVLASDGMEAFADKREIRRWASLLAADASDFVAFDAMSAGLSEDPATSADMALARAWRLSAQGKLVECASQAVTAMSICPPQDVRYWQALTLNLSCHAKLKSDRNQILAAIVARQSEFPSLGTPATRAALLKLLADVKGEATTTTSAPSAK